MFAETVGPANEHALATAKDAFAQGRDLVWDQTNLTRKVRAARLRLVPPGYTKIAVLFPTPNKRVLTARLKNRPGKTIPPEVVASTLERPSKREGFYRVQTRKRTKK